VQHCGQVSGGRRAGFPSANKGSVKERYAESRREQCHKITEFFSFAKQTARAVTVCSENPLLPYPFLCAYPCLRHISSYITLTVIAHRWVHVKLSLSNRNAAGTGNGERFLRTTPKPFENPKFFISFSLANKVPNFVQTIIALSARKCLTGAVSSLKRIRNETNESENHSYLKFLLNP
jgi:hypothetical protein